MCLRSNSSIDMDFLRNIFVNFFACENVEDMRFLFLFLIVFFLLLTLFFRSMLPMISGLLQLSDGDVQKIQVLHSDQNQNIISFHNF